MEAVKESLDAGLTRPSNETLVRRIVALAHVPDGYAAFRALLRSLGRRFDDDAPCRQLYAQARTVEPAEPAAAAGRARAGGGVETQQGSDLPQVGGLLRRPPPRTAQEPRHSLLGLDRHGSGPVKRPRYTENGDSASPEGVPAAPEAGVSAAPEGGAASGLDASSAPVFRKPAGDRHHARPRRPETPSLGSGLSETARKNLAAYQAKRDLQRRQRSASSALPPHEAEDRAASPPRHQPPPAGRKPAESRHVYKRPPSTLGPSDAAAAVTPRVPDHAWDERDVEYPEEDLEPLAEREEWEHEQSRLDREWYMADDLGTGVFGDESHNPFAGYADTEPAGAGAQAGPKLQSRGHMRQMERRKESDLWETHLMNRSGVGTREALESDFADGDENRVHLLIHQLRPPFLDGKQMFTTQIEPVSAVRDPQSDLAKFCVRGSRVVKDRREQKERQAAAAKAASIAGTALGNVMGVKDEEAIEREEWERRKLQGHTELEKVDNKFSTHMTAPKGGSAFSRSKSLREQREFLPAFAVRDSLLNIIRDNQVVIVIGETGSGKTTQLTQFLHEDGYSKYGLIGCTQPRRVAAMSVAKRVSEEMEVRLGGVVGYAIRFEDLTSAETKIKYMTDGVLLRESLVQNDLEKYSVIIMDEAHERALNTDILLGLLKRILARRRDLKLIVTSATMNAERFSSFFGSAPTFTIPGRTFPVDTLFSKSPCEDYVDAAVKQIIQIHLSAPAGDILVFMTGQEDIEMSCEITEERLSQLDNPPKLSILPIYSQMPADLQAKIFDAAEPGVRKCIVATNIAETSLTVDGIMYVIDTGFSKMKVFNPRVGMDALQLTPISQANAGQRAGRAGRTGPGTAYRLYTEAAYRNEMYMQTVPEIQRTNLANTVLMLKSLGVKDLLDFDFMDPPPQETMLSSLYDLWTLGAVDNYGNLTRIGRQMSAFPMYPSMAKIIIVADEYGCTEEMATIVSMLSVPAVFYRPNERQDEADAQREKLSVNESDHLTLLNVYNIWKMNGFRDRWASDHFLQPKALRRAREIRQQIVDILRKERISMSSCGTDYDVIRQVLCTGYFHQAARAKGLGEYSHLRTGVPCHLHPTSALYGLGFLPEYVIYHELTFTSKEYMSVVTSVDPRWLAEMGSMFYSIKERGSSSTRMGKDRMLSRQMEISSEIERDRQRQEREAQAARLAAERAKSDASTGRHVATPGMRTPHAVKRAETPRRRYGF